MGGAASSIIVGIAGLGSALHEWASRVPLAFAAAAPALAVLIAVDRFDRRGGEPRWLLRRAAALGAAVVLPVLAVELLLALVGMPVRGTNAWSLALSSLVLVAIPEELGKAACLAWLLARRLEFERYADGARYGARVGLGFAVVENLYYGLLPGDPASIGALVAGRAILTVPMHAVWGAIIGDAMARRRLGGGGHGLVGGLTTAAAGHAAFDFGLAVAGLAQLRGDAPGYLAAITLVLGVAAASVLALRRRLRAAAGRDADTADRAR